MSEKAFMHRSADGNFFPTPYSMTTQLFEKEYFDHNASVLEPACGQGHMVDVLRNYFRNVTAYDLAFPYEGEPCRDFYQENRMFDYLITNPPYTNHAAKFVQKAKEITRHKFAMLLRTNFLSGQGRYDEGVYEGLRSVYIFTRMTDFRSEIRQDGKYSTAGIVYAWMVWESGYRGKPQIDWLDNQQYVLGAADD